VTYAPVVVWAPRVAALPARDRLVFEDSEKIERNEDWVDSQFGVDNRGRALLLQLQGRAQLNFAEVTFGNGSVQVVDFNDAVQTPGVYTLLDFADGREVKQVRIVARARTKEAKLTVFMAK
jgi:3-methyladenine DNA glycosylase AlkD